MISETTKLTPAAPVNIYLSDIPEHASREVIRGCQVPMLMQALSDLGFSLPDSAPCVCRTEHGKPYLPDYPDFHYSFSDSGSFLLLAACKERETGADIQQIRTPRGGVLHFAERFFPPEDTALLKRVSEGACTLPPFSSGTLPVFDDAPDDADRMLSHLFTRIWTVRESYLKLLGTGLAGGIGSFPVDFESHKAGNALFEELAVPAGYAAAICWN